MIDFLDFTPHNTHYSGEHLRIFLRRRGIESVSLRPKHILLWKLRKSDSKMKNWEGTALDAGPTAMILLTALASLSLAHHVHMSGPFSLAPYIPSTFILPATFVAICLVCLQAQATSVMGLGQPETVAERNVIRGPSSTLSNLEILLDMINFPASYRIQGGGTPSISRSRSNYDSDLKGEFPIPFISPPEWREGRDKGAALVRDGSFFQWEGRPDSSIYPNDHFVPSRNVTDLLERRWGLQSGSVMLYPSSRRSGQVSYEAILAKPPTIFETGSYTSLVRLGNFLTDDVYWQTVDLACREARAWNSVTVLRDLVRSGILSEEFALAWSLRGSRGSRGLGTSLVLFSVKSSTHR